MSLLSVRIGDTVLIHTNDESHSQRIGVLEYIGYIDSDQQSKIVGINLVESVENGHDGTINGTQHFKAPPGHGIYVRIQNIIRKLNCTEVTRKMQQIIMLFKKRLTQYITAISERDEFIEELKNSRRRLKKILHKSQNHSPSNNLLHTIEELMTAPPPISMISDESTSYPAAKNSKKLSEYTKYNKNTCHMSDDTSSYTDTTSNAESSDEDITWCDGYCSSKKYATTPISTSTSNTHKIKYKQKSHSTHNTPHHSPIINDFKRVAPYENPQNMQGLYDMMIQQQQQNVQMQPLQRTQTVPSFQIQNTKRLKRRTLQHTKPIPEVRPRKRREKGLKLQDRRSNSVDMHAQYCFDTQVNVGNNPWILQQGYQYPVNQPLQYHI